MLTTLVTPVARAQNYPERPVRIVTAEAGGSQDVAARRMITAVRAT